MNDADQIYKDTILVFIDGMLTLMDACLENEEMIEKTAAYESVAVLIEMMETKAQTKIKEWEDLLEEN